MDKLTGFLSPMAGLSGALSSGSTMCGLLTTLGTSAGGSSVLIVDTEDAAGGTIREITAGGSAVALQGGKSVKLTSSEQTILPDAGYDGFASVTVDAGSLPKDLKWRRPADWPDIESLVPFGKSEFADFDGVFLTLDNTGNHAPWIKVKAATSSGKFVVERGHIANEAFVSDYSVSANSNNDTGAMDFSSCGYDYPIYFIHAESSSEHLTSVSLGSVNASETGLPSGFYGTETGCLECVGHIAYCGHCGGNGSVQLNGNKCMVREHLVFGDKIVLTSLNNAFNYMCCLEELDFSGFDTSNWEIATMGSAFNGCGALKKLDLSTLDKSKWALTGTGLGYCFYGLSSLEYLDLSGEWDTENFSLTSLVNVFNNGQNMRYCDISPIVYNGTTNTSHPRSQNLRELYPMTIYGNINYSDTCNLSTASIRRIINSLPEANYTLSLGRTNLAKITAEDVAIATNKGWTVN